MIKKTLLGMLGSTKKSASSPQRPSCVSSLAQDEVHKIDPLRYAGDAAGSRQKLQQVIRRMPLTRIQPAGVIQARSISRFGCGDPGFNRARIERIREAFAKP